MGNSNSNVYDNGMRSRPGRSSRRHRNYRSSYHDDYPEDIYSQGYPAIPPASVAPFVGPLSGGRTPPQPVMPMDIDPYYQQYASKPLRRHNSDPNLALGEPYVPIGFPPVPGGLEPYDPAVPVAFIPPELIYPMDNMRARWGSMPMIEEPEPMVQMMKLPRKRPLLDKIFGHDSVAQRKKILSKLDRKQIDPLEKTANWVLQSQPNLYPMPGR